MNETQISMYTQKTFCRKSEIFGCNDLKCKWNFIHKPAMVNNYKCLIMHCKEDRKE